MASKQDIIELYFDWCNNFLSMPRFAEHYEITEAQASTLIELGRSIYADHMTWVKEVQDYKLQQQKGTKDNGT